MFKHNQLTVLVTTAALALGGFAINVNAADGTGNATATIVTPLSVAEAALGSMNFGSISPDFTNPTTVDLSAAGGVTSSDGAGIVPASGAQEGTFTVTGDGTLAYDITLPVGAVTLTGGGGADTMTVDTFVDDSTGTGTLVGGTDTFKVGATLNVGANQATGAAYTGTYTVTVTYQ